MNRRRACGWMLAGMVSLLAGCNGALVGEWRAIEPAQVAPDVPRIRQIAFTRDSRFEARMVQNSRTRAVSGTYQFTGSQLILTVDRAAEADKYIYDAQSVGRVLLLTQNQVTLRLCREAAGSAPPEAPALPEEPAQQPVIPVHIADSQPAAPR